MKKIFVVVVALAMTLVGANAAFAAIANSKHDLSYGGSQTIRESTVGGLSSCQFCHTPHGSNTAILAAPLWNRSSNAGTTYSVYGGSGGATGSTAAGSGNVGTPGPHSMTCLGCHDGLLTVGATFNNGTKNMTNVAGYGLGIVSGLNNVGKDLQNDHPVGIAFTNAAPNVSGLASALSLTWYKFYQEGSRVDSFECGSCHDVHGFDFATGNANAPFLRRPKSTMCTECHSSK
jgi:hypothetical protein